MKPRQTRTAGREGGEIDHVDSARPAAAMMRARCTALSTPISLRPSWPNRGRLSRSTALSSKAAAYRSTSAAGNAGRTAASHPRPTGAVRLPGYAGRPGGVGAAASPSSKVRTSRPARVSTGATLIILINR